MGHMIERKPLEVVTKIGEFLGKPTIAIHEVKNGVVEEKHIINFGTKKAEAILAAIDDIREFLGVK